MEAPTSEEPATTEAPSRLRLHGRQRVAAIVAAAAVAILIAAGLAIGLRSGAQGPPTGAAQLVPGDALAYVNVALDRELPAVSQSLAIARRFPDFALASAAVQARFALILSGGQAVDFSSQIKPWLGDEAAIALLDTATSTAGSLIVVDVADRAKARAFVRAEGAVARGSYRGHELYAYPSGSELAFVSHFVVLGQDASVRAALDVAAGATQSLAGSPIYERAAAGESAGRVLDAYASVAGVRRLLAPQGGVIGALGELLYQPALQGVTIAVSPAAAGARVRIHSALDPTLQRLNASATPPFAPTLQDVMPTGSILMLDVRGLDRIAPRVLNAGAAAGVAGGVGPLLSRLGSALVSEGVNVKGITSIFDQETAVAIIPHAQSPALVIVARAPDQTSVREELAQLEIPLAQLFAPPSSGGGTVPTFNDRSVAGITDHQLVLANGLQLDYAVFRGLVVISTSIDGVAAVAQRTQPLAADPGFKFALGSLAGKLSSLVYVDFQRLLTLGVQTGLTGSATYTKLRPDLEKVSSIGLESTHSTGESTTTLSIRIP